MKFKQTLSYWFKWLGLLFLWTRAGHLLGCLYKQFTHFILKTKIGRVLVFLSLPLALLFIALWTPKYDLPIFDAQIHYDRASWSRVPVEAILNAAEELTVPWLLVGSIPNEGTWRLYNADPQRVIPMFVPAFRREDRNDWFNNTKILHDMEEEIASGRYRGIGEVFLFDGHIDKPGVKRLVKLAAEHSLVLHCRSQPSAIRQLFALDSSLRILWAHAGMFSQPEVINGMLDRYPRLWIEISHRGDVAPRGKLDKKWRQLMLRHSDRFLLGSGTYTTEYWYKFRTYMSRYRSWLKTLPREVAERIAFRNGLVLFDISDNKGSDTGSIN